MTSTQFYGLSMAWLRMNIWMEDEVVATPELLEEWLFDKQKAEVLFALADGKEVGIALFFHNFSTFLGRAGIYLEDVCPTRVPGPRLW